MKKFLATILSVILLLTIIPMAYAEESNTYKVGDIIQFGSYPQSEVKDEALIAELNALAPEWEEWTSYGYYSGNWNSGSMVQGDWMRFVDVTYNGLKYRGVKFTQYRSFATICYGAECDAQYLNGYRINDIYWFEFQPISWRVLDPNTGFILSEKILDSQAYSNTVYKLLDEKEQYAYYNDSSFTNYANDYETSSIREWLNDDFYNLAFTDAEKLEISVTECNNDNYCTLSGRTGYEEFNSAVTYDKIFLLSLDEIKNSNYGFYSGYTNDVARGAQGTNYAKCQGLYFNREDDFSENNIWWIRTPDINSAGGLFVDQRGFNNCYSYSYYSHTGVRPALMLKDLSNIGHSHKFFTTITAPTCTTQGYTTYTCECGDSYVADCVNVLGHKDDNGDYKCDNGCGYEYERSDTPENPSKACSCNCHKSGIMGFFWKIMNFFQKLFKTNELCDCGAKHW